MVIRTDLLSLNNQNLDSNKLDKTTKSNDASKKIKEYNTKKKSELFYRIKFIYIIAILIQFYVISFYNNDTNNENQIQKNDKFNFYTYLTDNRELNFFNESNKLIWSINNTNPNECDQFTPDESEKRCGCKLKFKCNFTEDLNLKCLFEPFRINYFSHHFVPKNLIEKNDKIYLHFYLIKNNTIDNKPIILHKYKELDSSNWISNYDINLIDYVDLNLKNESMFSKFIDYDPITGNYTPALLIDKSKNNSELTNNSTQLRLNLKFKKINFCEFIIYSCDRSSEDQQLNRICFEESSKLSTNFFSYHELRFASLLERLMTAGEIIFFKLSYLTLFYALIIALTLTHFLLDSFSHKFDSSNLEALSVNLIIFNLFRSFIFLLYELKRFSNFPCNFDSSYVDYLININLYVIYGWILMIIINFHKLSQIFKINLKYRIEYDKSTRQYDNLAFKYLSLIMIPLFIIYSIYSFHNYYHKNLYHFIINTLYGYLLNFGFIAMTSQVYINHKFKHTYKNFDVSLAFASLILISYEDILDYSIFRHRERFKLIYFRDELIYLIYFIQILFNFKREKLKIFLEAL